MAVKQRKIFRHMILVLILSIAFAGFFESGIVCLRGHEAKASEIGNELHHPTKPSGVEHEAVPPCNDLQGHSEALTNTCACCRNLPERQSFQILARQMMKAGLEAHSFSDLIKWDSEVNWAEPSKIFLQNQSFRI